MYRESFRAGMVTLRVSQARKSPNSRRIPLQPNNTPRKYVLYLQVHWNNAGIMITSCSFCVCQQKTQKRHNKSFLVQDIQITIFMVLRQGYVSKLETRRFFFNSKKSVMYLFDEIEKHGRSNDTLMRNKDGYRNGDKKDRKRRD